MGPTYVSANNPDVHVQNVIIKTFHARRNLPPLQHDLAPKCSLLYREYPSRPTSFPFISGDTFRSVSDHLFDETSSNMRPSDVLTGDIVFVKGDWISSFFRDIHPFITHKYILVTHNSDDSAPGKYSNYLESSMLVRWFGNNNNLNSHHLKMHPIPLGLANNYWNHGKIVTFLSHLPPPNLLVERPILLFIAFRTESNPTRGPILKLLEDKFKNESPVKFASDMDHDSYVRTLTESKFVASPEGNGIDCHRTWESIAMGAIPIVTKSTLHSLYDGMPVLIISDWNELTIGLMQSFFSKYRYLSVRDRRLHRRKVMAKYWFKELCRVRLSLQNASSHTV
jgi:hypothetical protein